MHNWFVSCCFCSKWTAQHIIVKSSKARVILLSYNVDGPSLPRFNNIGYVGDTYNILKGNPQATGGLDPGFLIANIFQFTYNQNLTTSDGKYLIPDNTTINAIDSCSFTFASSTTTDIKSYMDSLKVHVDADFSGWGASFSASSDYEEVHSSTQNSETVFISSHAECQTYGASVGDAPLIQGFRDHVSNLPVTNDTQEYISFIETWGTHVASSLIMGGRYGFRSSFTSQNYSSLVSSNFSIKASAGYSGTFSINANVGTEVEKEQADKFEESRKSYVIYQVGGDPPTSGNGSTTDWINTVKDNPLPVKYNLVEISTFLYPQYFPDDTNIDSKREMWRKAAMEYCESISDIDSALCATEFGPKSSDHITVQFITSSVLCPFYNGRYYVPVCFQYSSNPYMRIIGMLSGNYNDPNLNAVVAANSFSLNPELITNATGHLDDYYNFTRYTCPEGYSTVSDFFNASVLGCPLILPCIKDECLTQCSRGEQIVFSDFGDDHKLFLIGGGYPELGNDGNKQYRSFFRNLSIKDDTPETELFRCLTYECLSVM